jgi:CHAD domain-containing protein
MALEANQIEKSVRKLRKAVRRVSKQPHPEEVHDLRTGVRRLEAILAVLQLSDRPNERRVLRLLSGVRKKAGKVRDMDVLTSHASTVQVEGEQECLIQLLEHLGAERYRHARRLRRVLKKDGGAIRRGLKRTAAKLENILDNARNGASGTHKETPNEAAAATLHLSAELADPPTLDRRNLHPYRLRVKELRYVLQMAENGANKEFVACLGECKDAIGEWHDWDELMGIANKVLDHPNCKLIHKLRTISREKYGFALTITNRMRALYLHVSSGTGRRRTNVRFGPPQHAVRAASALAA